MPHMLTTVVSGRHEVETVLLIWSYYCKEPFLAAGFSIATPFDPHNPIFKGMTLSLYMADV